MKIHYLEIVTANVDAACSLYSQVHAVTFSDLVPELGNARTAEMSGGGTIGIRAPMHDDEKSVVRPYTLVANIDAAVSAAVQAGAEVALDATEIEGRGKFAIVFHGGIESGFWEV